MPQVELHYTECKRCGHRWLPRQAEVRICPKCKSPYWDKKNLKKTLPGKLKLPKGVKEERKKYSDFVGWNEDFMAFLNLLNKYGVEYCITGGYAVSFYVEPRYTEDLDIYVAKTRENSKKVANAVKDFMGEDIDEEMFIGDKVILRMGHPPNKIELSNHLSGLEETEIIGHCLHASYGNVETCFIGLDDLIINKGIVRLKSHRQKKGRQDERDFQLLNMLKESQK
ncbi:MAG: hypothetical protein JW803_02370 [Endomicrobiales bacterium]|nr:hypothetical protein [Endomicrobiales bacterium]